MEDKRPQQDDAESWKADTGTERPDFLARWMQRRHDMDRRLNVDNPESDDSEEDDDDDSESTIPQRFRKFFRRLVQRVVEPATIPAPPEVPPPADLFLNNDPSEPIERSENSLPQESEVADPYIPVPERVWSRQDVETSVATPLDQTEQPIEAYQRPLFERTQQSSTDQPELNVQHVTEMASERSSVPSTEPPVVEEKVIERHEVHDGSGLTTVLLGAEYFARRRADKKLERSFDRQVKDLTSEVEEGKRSQARLEKAVSSKTSPSRPSPERVSIAPDAQERRLPHAPSFEQSRPAAQERLVRPEMVGATSTPETSPQEAIVPDTDKLAERQVAPKVVLEKVAEAAEVNAPLERTYERRQEIKDDPGAAQQYAGGAAAVGHILSKSPHVLPYVPPATAGDTLPEAKAGLDISAYRGAMANGFWGAIAIVILALIAYVATK